MHSKVFFLTTVLAGLPAFADEPLTLDFSGSVAGGWLDLRSVSVTGDGYGYNGPVLQFSANVSADYAISETFSLGLSGRIRGREGTQARYDGINLGAGTQTGRFDTFDVDLAAYVSAGPLVLSYGDVESSFNFATLDVASDRSPISGDSAVLLNIGSGLGFAGRPLSDTSSVDPRYYTSRTARGDLTVGDFALSLSTSRNERGRADSAGVKWSKELGDLTLTIGAGYERGPRSSIPTLDYRSLSAFVQYKGFGLLINDIQQIRKAGFLDYEIDYRGYAISYDFGRVVVGAARAEQTSPLNYPSVFLGEAESYWLGWDINDMSSLDFEMSKSDYRTGNDVESMSLVYSYRF